jgi:murein DD-endopeptidase MepM/ murein hydrolase activator NlpD
MTLGAMLRAGLTTPSSSPVAALAVPQLAAAQVATIAAPVAPAVETGATVRPGADVLADRPVAVPVDGRTSSRYGPRVHPIHGGVRDHHGLDIAAPTGTPVRSVTSGTVVRVGDAGGYGLLVEVDHGDGITSRYAHLSASEVSPGDRLAVGEVLGAVGSTGASTGPHLHLEVRVDGDPIDPERVLPGV